MANEEFKNIQEVVDTAGQLIADAMRDGSLAEGLFATGQLARSITYVPTPTKDGVFGFQIVMEDYGLYQDAGFFRPAGKRPPLEPIIDWLQRKLIQPPQGMTIRSFAFAIQNKIGRDGAYVKARPFIQPAVDSVVNQYLIPNLEKAGVKDIEESIAVAIGKNDKMKVK